MTLARPPTSGTSQPPPPPWTPTSQRPQGWTALRITSLVLGSLLALVSLALLAGGAGGFWLRTHKDGAYLTAATHSFATPGYALASNSVNLVASGTSLGTMRIRATASRPGAAIFVGIAPANAAAGYLSGVEHTTVDDYVFNSGPNTFHAGGSVPTPPGRAGIWTVSASGTGTQQLIWPAKNGQWTIVVMNANGSRGVGASVNFGATFPSLTWVATGALAAGVLCLAGGLALIIIPVRRASRRD